MNTPHAGFARHLRTLVARQAADVLSDRQLLENFRTQRSEDAFAALVRRHGPMVLGVCRRVLGDLHDAEDAFQATFLTFVRRAASIRKPDSVGSFLHGVARHLAAKLKARVARRAAHERRLASRRPDHRTDDITWRELRAALDEGLARLPEKYRGPLVLCYLEGRTQDEAARQLGWSKAVFRRRLEQGRILLGRSLSRRGLTLSAALAAPLLAGAAARASVSPALTETTVRAGFELATGRAAAAVVPPQVATLVEGGTHYLLSAKVKIALAVLLAAGVAAGVLAQHAAGARAPAPPPAAPVPEKAKEATRPAPPRPDDETIPVKGRVLDPGGRPVSGAKVYVSSYTYKEKTDPAVRATTGEDGRFAFKATKTEVDLREKVAAVAEGFGPDWAPLPQDGGAAELTLRLVKEDVPIRGRVLDLEGRPIAGVTVSLVRVRKMPDGDLSAWIKDLQAKPNDRQAVGHVRVRYEQILSSVWGIPGLPKAVTTGPDGRFQLTGLGRERSVVLRVTGGGIEHRSVEVLTRPGPIKGLPPDVHAASFDHPAAPNKPIRGTVRERGTGKPAAGVHVGCQAGPGGEGEQATADAQGRFEIPGIRKSNEYTVSVGGEPYFWHSREVADTPGLEPITVNLEVERGLVVRGRVTERETGRPVPALIQYAVRPGNRALDDYKTFARNAVGWSPNEKDGSFTVVAVPGPGVIAVRALDDQFVCMPGPGGRDSPFEDAVPAPIFRQMFHAVVPISPSAKDAKSLVCDVALAPGRSVTGSVVGPDGRPLAGVKPGGLGSLFPMSGDREVLRTDRFTVFGLEPGKPRTVVFVHEAKGLAGAVVVRAEDKVPVTVRLGPRAAVTGRVVDASGHPRAGVNVLAFLADKQPAALPPSVTIGGDGSLRDAVLPKPVVTDAEGRFRLEGLVPGLTYEIGLRRGEKEFDSPVKDVRPGPGESKDLGAIKAVTRR
jgi:RNA polymerase sigma factor (sigma-70 family)